MKMAGFTHENQETMRMCAPEFGGDVGRGGKGSRSATVWGALTAALALALVVLLGLAGCGGVQTTTTVASNPSVSSDYESRYREGYALALVRTNDIRLGTFIEYYDDDLELLDKIEYPYGSMGNASANPVVSNGVMYTPATGYTGLRNTHLFTIGLDLVSGAVHEYTGTFTGHSLVASDDALYFAFHHDGDIENVYASPVVFRVDKASGEAVRSEVGFEGLLPLLLLDEDTLYAFNTVARATDEAPHAQPALMLMMLGTNDLQLRQTFDLEGYEGVSTAAIIGDRLYFATYHHDASSSTKLVHSLLYLQLANGGIEGGVYEAITSDYTFGGIAAIDGYLYVLQDFSSVEGSNEILIVDKEAGTLAGELALDYHPQYIYALDGCLYVAGSDTKAGGSVLGCYQPDGDALEAVKEVRPSREEETGDYHVAGIFSAR